MSRFPLSIIRISIVILLSTICVPNILAQSTLSEDGGWCWFSDPRAIYIHGEKEGVLTGWVTSDGSIEASLLNIKDETFQTEVINPQLEKDDHDNPSFLEIPEGYMAFYTKHSKKHFYYHRQLFNSSILFPEAILFDPNDEKELEKYPLHHVTYANPYMLKAEQNRIYCFGRWTGFKPNIMWSDDLGATFTKSKVFISEEGFRSGNRPYVKYFSDGNARIHFVFTDGHPRNEAINSVYYAYYENGIFYKINDEKICTVDEIPFRPDQATLVYQADSISGRAWIYDIGVDKKGDVGILYARYPSEKEHIYKYALYTKNEWHDHDICNSGKWFPQTREGKIEREPHYSGGMTINPQKLSEIYISREIKGVFEIEKRHTKDKGENWKITPITQNSKFDNIRPFFPRNMQKKDKPVVLWMENEKYIHYTDFQSKIKYLRL